MILLFYQLIISFLKALMIKLPKENVWENLLLKSPKFINNLPNICEDTEQNVKKKKNSIPLATPCQQETYEKLKRGIFFFFILF